MSRLKVFSVCTRTDRRWLDRMMPHLQVLSLQNLIDPWDDEQIGPGIDWLQETNKHLLEARVAIIFVSPAFLSSTFVCQNQVPSLLYRHERDGLVLCPLLVKPCLWREVPWLNRLQLRPRDGRSLSTLRSAKADEVLADVATEIASIVREPDVHRVDRSFTGGSRVGVAANAHCTALAQKDTSIALSRFQALVTVRDQMLDWAAMHRDAELSANSLGEPTEYFVKFRAPSFAPPPVGETSPTPINEHEVFIRLPEDFPDSPPEVYWQTPIFHPQVDPATGVLKLRPETLDAALLLNMICDLAALNNYLVNPPDSLVGNPAAVSWFLSPLGQKAIVAQGGRSLRERVNSQAGDRHPRMQRLELVPGKEEE